MSTEDKGRGNVISLAERASSRRRKVRPALPIGVRPLSERYSARTCTVATDQVKFLLALHHYSRAPSPRKWRLAKRRLTALGMAVSRCCDLVDMLGGDVPAGTEPVFKTEQDQYEHKRLADFIATKALPFIEFWEKALAAVDAGAALPIEPKDVPVWGPSLGAPTRKQH
jgi:hypothetical protein